MHCAHEPVAQSVEHVTFNHGVLGSSPSGLTNKNSGTSAQPRTLINIEAPGHRLAQEGSGMRWSLLCFRIVPFAASTALAALAIGLTAEPSAAEARYGVSYRACHCHFGYVRGKGECAPAIACLAEGGRCHEPCGTIYEPDQ
jgi:hypothetical protein